MISIIFITKNRIDELSRALNSCFQQSYKDVEYIIIDNASSRNEKDTIDDLMFRNGIAQYDYVYLKKNRGVAGGRNLGFRKAKGKYCLFLDDDAVLINDDFLELAINDFEKDEKIAAIACDIFQPLDNTYLFSKYIKNDCSSVISYVGAAHLLRKEYWDESVLYPDNIMYGSEELYAALFIYQNRYRILYDKELKTHHLPSQINRTDGKKRDLNIILNTYVCRKYFYPKFVVPLLYLGLMLHLCKNGLLFGNGIKQEIRKRYDRKYENKMSYSQFRKIWETFTLKNIF